MVSILTPIKNGIEFLPESIETVFNQTYKEWELLIGVNGHDRQSKIFYEAAKNITPKIIPLDMYYCKSKSETLNEMLKVCKYDIICLLDVDDKWRMNKLERQVPYMEWNDVVGTYCQYFGDKTNHPILPTGELNNSNFKVNPIINSSVMLRKEDCQWDSKWEGIEDFELWLRLLKAGKKFYNINDVLTYHRVHAKSAFNGSNNERVAGLRKVYGLDN